MPNVNNLKNINADSDDYQPKLEIVIPVHNENKNIKDLLKEIDLRLTEHHIKYHIIFVDDGSVDDTLKTLRMLHKSNRHVDYISFAKQFGKESAMLAGLKEAVEHVNDKDYVAIMDADFQDPPEELPQLYTLLQNNKDYDSIATKRANYKNESKFGRMSSKMFYWLNNKLSDIKMPVGARDFRIMRVPKLKQVVALSERDRFSRYLFEYMGMKTYYVNITDAKRHQGKSSWNFQSLFRYATHGLVGNPSKLPQVVTEIGGIMFGIGLLGMIITWLNSANPAFSILYAVHVLSFLGILLTGVIVGCVGLAMIYLAEIMQEVKKRPLYYIKETSFNKFEHKSDK